jgi:Ni/Fe-hydrogenase 1 B-type cytochrome subunit
VTAPLTAGPVPTRPRADPPEHAVYVFDAVVRLTHWVIALAIVVLAVTGLLLARPVLAAPGEAGQRFVTGITKVVHFYASIAFTLAVAARLVWLVIGPPYARWTEMIPVHKERFRQVVESFKFYAFLRKSEPHYAGHNALAGVAYGGILALYLVQIATGFALYGLDASVNSPMRYFQALLPWLGGAQTARWIHHGIMWVIILFTIQHLYSLWLSSKIDKNGEVDSMFSGYKHLRDGEDGDGKVD